MKGKLPELYADPFEERRAASLRRDIHLLGARIQFESNCPRLLRLVDNAYAGLPRHQLSRDVPRLRVRLVLSSKNPKRTRPAPAPLHMMSGGGLLAGTTAASNFVVMSPKERAALVVVSPRMLRFPYHTRYELIEFAVLTLATRVQGLVALHGACVGSAGRGVLLVGPSGAGKSTLTLQCLTEGVPILSEDSVFVAPDTLLATGVSNFLHVRADSLRWISKVRQAEIRSSPVIRRRTGVRKYEVDLRCGAPLVERPLAISAIVFLSARSARQAPLLAPLGRKMAMKMLEQEQAYAANQASWAGFRTSLGRVQCFELRRGQHPRDSVAALRGLINPPVPAVRPMRRASRPRCNVR